jgi:hypothetical protein
MLLNFKFQMLPREVPLQLLFKENCEKSILFAAFLPHSVLGLCSIECHLIH